MGRVPYYPNVNLYKAHYGGNLPVFRGYKPNIYTHRGAGFFGNLIKGVIPLIKSGAKSLLKTGLKTGTNILSDVVSGNTNFESAVRNRGREAVSDIRKSVVNKLSSKNNIHPVSKQRQVRAKKIKNKKRLYPQSH
jgi:hypothetical protein